MSKAFTPPPTMSDDDILAVADVRRNVWTGGFEGLGFGLAAGYLAHRGCSRFLPSIAFPPVFKHGKYATMWTFIGGAVFSYIGASSAGKNSVSGMYEVFTRGARPKLTEYQEAAHGGVDFVSEQRRETNAFERRVLALEESRKERALAMSELEKRTRG